MNPSIYRNITIKGVDKSMTDSRFLFDADHSIFGDVAVKLSKFDEFKKLGPILSEAFIHARLRHPNVCEVKDAIVAQNSKTEYELLICMEKCESDLNEEISARRRNQQKYPEHKLLGFLADMTDALAQAQQYVVSKQNICHRDIKPENILIAKDGTYKLGDFGEAKFALSESGVNSLHGTYGYLSPLCRKALANYAEHIIHNPFKDDVYSLGMTLLSMAALKTFSDIEQSVVVLLIDELQYSDQLKRLIQLMLREDENLRPDFTGLHEITKKIDTSAKTAFFEDMNQAVEVITNEIRSALEATSRLASNIEKLWASALLSKMKSAKWGTFQAPQFYYRKCELLDTFREVKNYAVLNRIMDSEFDFIPITDLVTTELLIPSHTLLVEKKNELGEFDIVTELKSQRQTHCVIDSSCKIAIQKDFSTVTIAEELTDHPLLMRPVSSDPPERLLRDQFYRLGNVMLTIESISDEELTLSVTLQNCEVRTYALNGSNDRCLLGRSPDCFVSIPDQSVSASHAVIWRQEGRWLISDCKSSNGTWLLLHTKRSINRRSNELRVTDGMEVRTDMAVLRFRLIIRQSR